MQASIVSGHLKLGHRKLAQCSTRLELELWASTPSLQGLWGLWGSTRLLLRGQGEHKLPTSSKLQVLCMPPPVMRGSHPHQRSSLSMTCHASELSCSGGCWECIDGRLRLPAATLPGGAEAWRTGLHCDSRSQPWTPAPLRSGANCSLAALTGRQQQLVVAQLPTGSTAVQRRCPPEQASLSPATAPPLPVCSQASHA